jgi:hypothetical protein
MAAQQETRQLEQASSNEQRIAQLEELCTQLRNQLAAIPQHEPPRRNLKLARLLTYSGKPSEPLDTWLFTIDQIHPRQRDYRSTEATFRRLVPHG